jgi:hypothetical protein
MAKRTHYILLLHVATTVMWLGAYYIGIRSCPQNSCGEAGLVFVPLFLLPLIATISALILDITLFVKRASPDRYKPLITRLVPTLFIGLPLLWAITVAIFTFNQHNFSTKKQCLS